MNINFRSIFAKINTYSLHLFGAALICIGLITGCADKEHKGHSFAERIEKAHNVTEWNKKEAFKTNISVSFGGKTSLKGILMVQTDGPGIRLELSGDTMAVFDGQKAWVMPNDSAMNAFQLKTWAYFLKAPYKLNDPGTILKKQDTVSMNGKKYDTAKLTFKSGTGDTPDDWFILYRDKQTNRLHAMAYIVTANTSLKKANKYPHGITYENTKMIDDIPVATTWIFRKWSATSGFSNQPIGQARLTNISFINADDLFKAPENAMPMK